MKIKLEIELDTKNSEDKELLESLVNAVEDYYNPEEEEEPNEN